MINSGFDVNRRDHVGRTLLHLAILSKMVDIACDLIDAGARITARLVDGRTPLHLAAQMDVLPVVKKLLARSSENAKRAEEEKISKANREDKPQSDSNESAKAEESDCERPSSEDDWSSEESEKPDKPTPAPDAADTVNTSDIPEDDQTLDVLDVNLADWDHAFTPLLYAVLYSSLSMVDELLAAGADPTLVTKTNEYQTSAFLPLTVTLLRTDEDNAAKIAERLIQAGASSSAADANALTLFHRAVCFGSIKMVKTLLQKDPNAAATVNFPYFPYGSVAAPLATAVAKGHYSILAILLAYGANLDVSSEDVQRAEVAL
jgi:ankyrin repeat protein